MAKRGWRVCIVCHHAGPARWRTCMEPRAATPERRLQAIEELTRAGVPSGMPVAPMIPGLNDAEMEKIVEAAARAGARHAGYVLLRLPHKLRQMFEDWLRDALSRSGEARAQPDPRDAIRRADERAADLPDLGCEAMVAGGDPATDRATSPRSSGQLAVTRAAVAGRPG